MINGYTESEICALYRQAKNKKLQIEILTQLTGLRTFEVEKIWVNNFDGGLYLYLSKERNEKV